MYWILGESDFTTIAILFLKRKIKEKLKRVTIRNSKWPAIKWKNNKRKSAITWLLRHLESWNYHQIIRLFMLLLEIFTFLNFEDNLNYLKVLFALWNSEKKQLVMRYKSKLRSLLGKEWHHHHHHDHITHHWMFMNIISLSRSMPNLNRMNQLNLMKIRQNKQ